MLLWGELKLDRISDSDSISVLAPEVLAGRCPAPCNPCIKDQIRQGSMLFQNI